MNRGSLFVISAPSGTGKTTILKRLFHVLPALAFSVSHTTRKPRRGERDAVDYHFISREEFLAMRDTDAFLEWAEVHGNLYGTSKKNVEASQAAGQDILLDIDVQGARQIRKTTDVKAVFIFIVPPSWEELERRLRGRGSEDSEVIALRLSNARLEMQDVTHYDHIIVNDRIDNAVDMLRAVILAERSKTRRTASGEPIAIFETRIN